MKLSSRFHHRVALVVVVVAWLAISVATPAGAESYVPISGAGSSWSFNALDQWRRDVDQYGMRVNYAGNGSSDGRSQFLKGTVDFAASDIPFQYTPEDGSAPEDPGAKGLEFAYMPVTAGGTAFMYNLTIGGKRVTNLRLSTVNVTKIFTGVISKWNDPALVADNPGLTLPDKKIVPVVRSDGSGSSAQLTAWMINQHPGLWSDFCRKSGKPACGQTSYYPTPPGGIAQAQDIGVAGYVSQGYADGAIGYVNYSYALNTGFPVAKLLNAAGYYTEPTPSNVAVSLLKADVNRDASSRDYLTQKLEGVYSNPDKRTYSLSSYSYMILPTKQQGQFNKPAKGTTLAAYSYYAMCQGQQQSASLGYSPMPINLVQASFDQIRKVPGAVVQNISIQSCNNPTFTADGSNKLANDAPQPQECDKQGASQCATGTGGASKVLTPVKGPAGGAAGANAPGAGGGGGAAGGGPGGAANGASGDGAATGEGSTAGGGNGACVPDPDTGECVAGTGGNGAGGSGNEVAAAPLTLAASSGWGSTQTLMVLAGLLTMILVLAPGVFSVVLARRRSS